MPVCLNCGKVIESGHNFCDECGALKESRIHELYGLMEKSKYEPRLLDSWRFVIISFALLAVILVAMAFAFLSFFPNDAKSKAKIQSSVCKHNMQSILEASDKYHQRTGKELRAGIVGPKHSLVREGYLKEAPRCPTTKKYYTIETSDSKLHVLCPSKVKSHSLEEQAERKSTSSPIDP
ncbi:MAG: zinc ribbon domain-containing protein [Actinomycetota bacterium]|nr:zinc ribbon domain-containing protein [Actinomycetota bacterium]